MGKIKEISKRCEVDYGTGPAGMDKVISEMVVEIEGEKKYLTCVWVSGGCDGLSLEVSDAPIMDLYLNDEEYGDEIDELLCSDGFEQTLIDMEEEYEGDYQEQFAILQKMVVNKLKEEGFLD